MSVPADKVVLTSGMVTIGSTVIFNATPSSLGGRGQLPPPRLLIGSGITFFGLSIMADFAPSIAAPLSAAIAITALTYYGLPILDNYINPKSNRTENRIHTGLVAGPPAPGGNA
jgi:hypothetical protein